MELTGLKPMRVCTSEEEKVTRQWSIGRVTQEGPMSDGNLKLNKVTRGASRMLDGITT